MIATFYSYKGGSGRTLALANIAVLLATKGHRVLAVDFDLEAPGLSQYLQSQAQDVELDNCVGLLDLLSSVSTGQRPNWREFVTPIQRYGRGELSMMTSGRQSEHYARRLLEFDWGVLFSDYDGGSFIESMRDEWRETYDFILVDSRTGITDSGGICTIQLPDLIVAVFTASVQSVKGVIDVMERAQRGRQVLGYDRARLAVVPLPSRVEMQTEHELRRQWQERFAADFAQFYRSWVPHRVPIAQLLERTTLPYIPFYSYGEPLPVLDEGTTAPGSLGYALETVSRLLESRLTGAEQIVFGDLSPVREGPAVWGGVPPRNAFFAGRTKILDILRNSLREGLAATLVPYALHGLGGVGKSQAAVEYAYRNRSAYDLIWWVPADDEMSIRRSLTSLARRLGVRESNDVQIMIDAALEELRLGIQFPRWILIFDNAVEPETVRHYVPGGSGHVLITSRNAAWKGLSAVVEVDVFSGDESVEFLLRRWSGLTRDEALTLAGKLGHLPLALDQAVAVHEQTGMPVANLLALLEADPGSFLGEAQPTEYPVSVAMTYRLAFSQLTERNAAAGQLLELCAFLSSHPIWVPMLRQGRGARLPSPLDETLRDEFRFRLAVRDIGRYALAQLHETQDFLTVHTLVRAVLRDGLSQERRKEVESSAHEVLALANPGAPNRNDTWRLHSQIAPHVIPSRVLHSEHAHVRQIVLDQVGYTFTIGDYVESRNLAEHAIEVWQDSLGPDDVMTLLAKHNLGNALRSLGEYQRARQVTEETVERMTRILGGEHPFTLRAANGLGADLRMNGEFAAARRHDEQNLVMHKRIFGAEDELTLRVGNNLAVSHRLLGEFERARELDDEVFRGRTVVLGVDNPETLASIVSLVQDLYGLGRYRDASHLLTRHLPSLERLTSKHRFALWAQRQHSILSRKLGDYRLALELAVENLDSTRAQFRSTHEHNLASTMTLANSERLAGDTDRALNLCEQALRVYRETLGERHPFTCACMVNLAIANRAVGRAAQATALDDAAFTALGASLGLEHEYTMSCASNLASDLASAGRTSEALAQSQRAVALWRSARPDHPYALLSEANLALDLAAAGEPEEGRALQQQTVAQLKRTLGIDHPETVSVERGRRADLDIELPQM